MWVKFLGFERVLRMLRRACTNVTSTKRLSQCWLLRFLLCDCVPHAIHASRLIDGVSCQVCAPLELLTILSPTQTKGGTLQ